ncbi:MAG: NAD(P)/FAD-dependent oxidoreductase [Acidobacteria bacterium]|nr:NAD(P)/FAD-dependent oxidoreductase [Acidobacteriota bacterium]
MASLDYDLAVIGGGPAGTSAAITAARGGVRVLLAERGRLPRHKVCGEFVSAEALGQLTALLGRVTPFPGAPLIGRARIFVDEQMREAPVEPPAVSISRYELDAALWQAAEDTGADARQQFAITAIHGSGPFTLATVAGEVRVRGVIDASGRWSNLAPQTRNSGGSATGERWIGLKGHYVEAASANSVDLHIFDGGYCGVQPISKDAINACALVRPETARTLLRVFAKDRTLWRRSLEWQPLTDAVSTSPIFFREPTPVRNGVLCAGDAAGFIDPFVGDGISLALCGGALAARSLVPWFEERVTLSSAARTYQSDYQRAFLPIFRKASRIRQLFSLPRAVRAPVLAALRSRHVAGWLVTATRPGVKQPTSP